MYYIGCDGCRSGWASVSFDEYWNYEIGIFRNIEALCNKYNDSIIFIDIPIGLPKNTSRLCDQMARRLLGKRSSSVFSTPSLDAVYAENYDMARKLNIENTGKSLSKQAWNITNKIKEVNNFILNNIKWKNKIREIHPEVVFYSLNDKTPMEYYKKTKEGEKERIDLLKKYYFGSEDIIEESFKNYKKDLFKDDIIDALCGAVIAKLGTYKSLPDNPPVDTNGIPMEMIYYENKDVSEDFIKIF
jgi:predicted RNase H-like nuclease